MHLGVPLSEYERSVGAKNQLFHEQAEAVRLGKQGVLPVDPDDAEQDGMMPADTSDAAEGDEDPSETFDPDDVETHGRR